MNDETEVWRPIEDFPPYEVSSEGRIRNGGKILKPLRCNGGYWRVTLWRNKRPHPMRINRIVCATFNGPCPPGKCHAAHKNGINVDNRPSNLYWASSLENIRDKQRHGTQTRGEAHGLTKLTEEEVKKIRIMLSNGMSCSQIAVYFNVCRITIYDIARGRTWRHL